MTNSASQKPSTARSAVKIMFAVMGSRVLGLVREVVLNAIFGAGKELDAFITAFRIPNLLRDLFAEGALSTAFVTTFSKKLAAETQQSAFRLANLVLTSMTVGIGIIALLGIFGSEWIVQSIAPGFSNVPGKTELTIHLTQILFPFILLVSLAAVYMGLLNSLGSFGLPASASSAFNAVSILTGLGIGWLYDPHLGPHSIYGFAIGTIIGGFVQFFIQVPRARQLGYHFQWEKNFKDPGLIQVYKLTLPAVIAGAAVQINVLVNTYFASYLGDGAVTWLNNAFRLMQLPIGMFGVAVSMVTLPSVSQFAALKNYDQFRSKVSEGLQLALFMTIPASAGLGILAKPIITVIYQRGAFTSFDTSQTALALQAYAIGLASYACIKVLVPTFYALDLPKIPVRISLTGIFLNIVFNIVFIHFFKLGLMSLPLSTSLVALINLFQLAFALRNRLQGLQGRILSIFLTKLLTITTVMSFFAWILNSTLSAYFHGFYGNLLLLSIIISISIVLFSGFALIAKMQEIDPLFTLIKRRILHIAH
jgi:putative peptidoglycan lipid II flippase